MRSLDELTPVPTGRRCPRAFAPLLAGALLALSSGVAFASIESPPRVKDKIRILQAYVAVYNTTDFTGDSPYANVVVKADDPHDSLLLYTTNQPCAATYEDAINMVGTGTDGDEIADLDIGADSLAFTWYRVRHERYTYELEGHGDAMEQAGEYSTMCAMLYDATGDPPQSLYPHGIPRNHIWKRAQAHMPIGVPKT